MRIGFFGGTFDPPHRAHLLVAQTALERCGLDRVLLAPAGRQPLKSSAAAAGFPDRLRMTALLAGTDRTGCVQASDVDGPQADGVPNYTVDALRRLRATMAPEDALFAITGADSFLDLRRWRAPDELLALAEWVVVSRPGAVRDDLDRLGLQPAQRARVHWLGGVADPVSATEVRARLAAGLDCRDLVPEPVLQYIRKHGLYAPPTA